MSILTYKSYHAATTTPTLDDTTERGVAKTLLDNQNQSNEQLLNNTKTMSGNYNNHVLPDYLQLPESYNMPDLLFHVLVATGSSETLYHVVCGFLQLYYYRMRRDRPQEWKCQPHRFLTRSNEIHEVVVGTSNLILSGGMHVCV